ncbi:MAG: hypothetical protein COW30_06280 [Rhodospirillales bacterium CG15_BIG_FIL_POST_REV_8_21_14_020_66_15]|nr:MAG: hypothetical protein COW30_06280 [Rhodospirillales bacterium CG15_BIG_FIL_POST_REV_8_21_14_020_66_15]
MVRAVFVFALSAVLSAASTAEAMEVLEFGVELPHRVAWVGRIEGAAVIRLADGSHHTVGLDEQGVTLSPRPEPLPPADSGDGAPMPDEVVVAGTRNIRAAWYRRPTERYGHGVLGDAIEAGGLALRLQGGSLEILDLTTQAVFEDRAPRIVDIDGDGVDEILAVKTYTKAGAALAVIETSDRGLRQAAESEPIGQPYRWLNPVGVGDFDGDGRREVAAVVTPHLGGTLTLYEWRGERLAAEHAAPGFSNHEIGSREQGLSDVADMDGDGIPDLIVPDAARRNLRVVTFAFGTFRQLAEVLNAEPIDLAVLAQDLDGDGRAEAVLAPGGRLKVVKFLP